jgi:2-hydroxycyclohexanecarboxyl-CoA dehydrogenase
MPQVLVTGASSDIGIEVCKLYLAEGFRVVGLYNAGQESFFDFMASSENAIPLQVDFTESGALDSALKEHSEIISASDVLINAAARWEVMPYEDLSADKILGLLQINLLPGVMLTAMLGPEMASRGWGRIVHVSSIGVKFGGGSASFAYALSKHALEFMPSAVKDWAAHSVLVNVLRVGVTDTRMHGLDADKNMADRIAKIPAKRMATTGEIARSIHWFGSDQNSFITGQTVAVSGGE